MNSQFIEAETNRACMRTNCDLVKRQGQPMAVDRHFRSATEITFRFLQETFLMINVICERYFLLVCKCKET
jgi:hypothetical protein